jgi:TRAP transporter TAXI family solute receptor
MRAPYASLALVAIALLLGACSRGPDAQRLEQDVQSRVNALFGRQVLALETLRRQGSAPYRAGDDSTQQVIVYYNAILRVEEAYDPSDWQGLSPTMIANALGAADEGITGLRAGPNDPGTELRAYGSIVYRRVGGEWRPAGELTPRAPAPAALGTSVPGSRSEELVRRLAELVQKAPARRGKDDEIIADELGRALENIRLRTGHDDEVVLLAAGPEGGEYWRFLASVVARIGGPMPVALAASAGSVENAFLIDRGDARIGLVQSDVAAAAVTGAGVFSDTGPLDHLRAMASLFPEPIHVVVRAGSGIERLGELQGRRVALGAAASGTRRTAMRLLEAAGIDIGTIEVEEADSPTAALERLVNGDVDAVIEVVSAPWRQLEIAMDRTPLELVALEPEVVESLGSDVHGLLPLAIPARTYRGQERAVTTVAATALMVARDDVSDALVVEALDLLFASASSGLSGVQATRLSKERALDGVTIPLHAAAARYFAKAASDPPRSSAAVPRN